MFSDVLVCVVLCMSICLLNNIGICVVKCVSECLVMCKLSDV